MAPGWECEIEQAAITPSTSSAAWRRYQVASGVTRNAAPVSGRAVTASVPSCKAPTKCRNRADGCR